MKTINENVEILSPINQLNLYGYEDYFHFFIKLFIKKEMVKKNSIIIDESVYYQVLMVINLTYFF